MMREKIHVSPYNFTMAVTSKENLPSKVIINDCTLRQAEQAPLVTFTDEEKILLAEKLDEVGVPQIEVGYALRDKEIIRTVKNMGFNFKIQAECVGATPDWKEHIDAAIECECDSACLVVPCSDGYLKMLHKMTREDLLERAVESVEYAKERGAFVMYHLGDAPRADLDFLKEISSTVVKAGANRICISDTVGTAKPATMRYLVEETKKTVDISVEVHCHNDFGLALANTLAGIEAGAEVAQCTINGLADRGTAPLDELVMSLTCLYNVDTGIKTEKLYELSRLHESLTHVRIPDTKPIIGKNAFAEKLDMHVLWAYTKPFLLEAFDPELVGNKRWVSLGKGTGPIAVKEKAKELGITVPEEKIPNIVKWVNEEAEKKKFVTDEQFRRVMEKKDY